MIAIAWYLLKVIICSGILYAYYYLALRNKIFHYWNRFYLLTSVMLALLLPVIKINILETQAQPGTSVIKMFQTINAGDDMVIEFARNNNTPLSWENILWAIYLLIAVLLLSIFLVTLFRIYKLKRMYPSIKMQDILFINTDAKGTPFSFLRFIFWNNAIDIATLQGQQIFNHEVVHIREKHSYDKIFIQLVLIFFWINPFFWLIRRELSMIHEFIADKKSLESADSSGFATMLLQSIYPGQTFSLTNNFFHSPIKRRLVMFTKNKNPKVSYISRLVALPLITLVFFAFTFKTKTISPFANYAAKKLTVVIDAGHGGSDNGAIGNSLSEKNLTLAIANDIQQLNTNSNLNIVLSRTDDETMSPKERVNFTEKNNADLFISLHANTDPGKNDNSGIEVLIANKTNAFLEESKLLGSAIIGSLKNNSGINVSDVLRIPEKGVWVLNNNICPSILIETGYLSNKQDVQYLSNPDNQKNIAQNILNGIEAYSEQNTIKDNPILVDTPPQSKYQVLQDSALYIIDGKVTSAKEANHTNPNTIKSISILKGNDAIQKYGDKGKNGVIIITTKPATIANKADGKSKENLHINDKINTAALYVIDGKEATQDDLKSISPQSIQSINVLKDETAIKKYGERGKNGVVEITLKKETTEHQDTVPDKIFTRVEQDAQFPGGQQAWLKYITRKIQDSANVFTEHDYGTCYVKFIVGTDGRVSDVTVTTMKNTHLANVAVNAIKTGPMWLPAEQNGHTVAAYRVQPVTLTAPEK